jgi:predicted ATP-dependent protease
MSETFNKGAHGEVLLISEKIKVERKHFYLDLKQNDRGRFLKITEDVRGRRDTIILPATGLEDFARAMDAIIERHLQDADLQPQPENQDAPRIETVEETLA